MKPGRPNKINKQSVKEAIHEYFTNYGPVKDIAEKYGMSRRTLYRKVHQFRPNHLTRRENLYLMNRYSLELIHNGGKLFTGLRTTIADTATILHNGEIPPNTLPSDVDTLLTLKRGFQYIERHTGSLTLKIIQHINEIVAYDSLEPGHFAFHRMHINGVHYVPPMPSVKNANAILNKYEKGRPSALKAVKIMLQFDRYQFFWNGNKRTAWLSANYYLLQHGLGILNITQHQENQWTHLLQRFYETGEITKIARWVDQHCIVNQL